MDKKLYPTAEYPGLLADNREISFILTFHRLDFDSVGQLATTTFLWLYDFLEKDFVTEWTLSSPNTCSTRFTKVKDYWLSQQKETPFSNFIFSGMAKSSKIYNAKTFKQYLRSLFTHPDSITLPRRVAPDYHTFFRQLFPNSAMDDKQIKEALICLFSQEPGEVLDYCAGMDVEGLFRPFFYSKQHKDSEGRLLMRGTLSLSFRASCFRDYLNETAEQLNVLARQLTSAFPNTNATIGLEATPSPMLGYNMVLFGRNPEKRGSLPAGYCANEWYEYQYLPRVGWANYISAESRSLPNESNCRDTTVIREELENGALYVGLKKPIIQATIQDLLSIKRILYHSLYPGESEWPLSMLFDDDGDSRGFRRRWELVPVFDEEISVEGDKLFFRHRKACQRDSSLDTPKQVLLPHFY